MKRICIPVLALMVGFANAYFAFQFSSLLFCLVPLWAFVFGYFSSVKRGALCGLLLFIGYWGFALVIPGSLMGMVMNLVLGGLMCGGIGSGAALVRRIKRFKVAWVLAVLLLPPLLCGYISLPTRGYSYYEVAIYCSENLSDIELYLPVAAISREPYTEIVNPTWVAKELGLTEETEVYCLEMVNTEHGEMLKLGITNLQKACRGEYKYPFYGGIILRTGHGPREWLIPYISKAPGEKLELLPKYETKEVKVLVSERFIGLLTLWPDQVVEEFKIPLKASSSTPAEVLIKVENRSSRHVAFSRYESYSEKFQALAVTNNKWIVAEAEARSSIRVLVYD